MGGTMAGRRARRQQELKKKQAQVEKESEGVAVEEKKILKKKAK